MMFFLGNKLKKYDQWQIDVVRWTLLPYNTILLSVYLCSFIYSIIHSLIIAYCIALPPPSPHSLLRHQVRTFK